MKGFVRPDTQILPDGALVPRNKRVDPAPNRFTHTIEGDQPYSYGGSPSTDGVLASGSAVLLARDDEGGFAWVITERGLYVRVASGSLIPKRAD